MQIFRLKHNKKVLNIFLKLTRALNHLGIIPIIYGSLGLMFLIGEHGKINDIDFIIADNDFSRY